jgi:molybdenum cofactor cytidylyltransferase
MRGANKLLEPLFGTPLVAQVVDRALEARAAPVVVVSGHEAHRVAEALADRPIELIRNPRWDEGLSTSLSVGLAALEGRVEGALICLGDMPRVTTADLCALLSAFQEDPPAVVAAWVPVHAGRRGNPVLWSARWFAALRELRGDRGAKALLGELGDRVVEVSAGPGVLFDIDTPEELDESRKKS